MMRRLWFGALALAAACSAEKDTTLLVAYVDTDLLVPAELNRIDIRSRPKAARAPPPTSRSGAPLTSP